MNFSKFQALLRHLALDRSKLSHSRPFLKLEKGNSVDSRLSLLREAGWLRAGSKGIYLEAIFV